MSGKKGMRHYSEAIKTQLRLEHEDGESICSLSKKYGISRYAIQSWCNLRPEVNIRQKTPLLRGRKPNRFQTLEQEVRRLRMENAMMRDFLKDFGRR